ncbi:hypothetical protein NDU88_002373 [Pleurodeles waltl]|uniref:Uncharacterized protein n=1 Tax=Pleurodeles waltl TaxID=8319 RepID=A0AAV7UZK5_PLEWA|nr:hypothetical protein NDU88_002373 [Pleurodeles waltl]
MLEEPVAPWDKEAPRQLCDRVGHDRSTRHSGFQVRSGSRRVNERVRTGCGLMLGVGTGHSGKRGHLRRPRRPGGCAWAEDPPELRMRGRYKFGQPVETTTKPPYKRTRP